jgi:ribonuclease P protein component
MLAKSRRLTAHEVREVLKNGRSLRAGSVSARYTRVVGKGKAAVVVNTKVAKRAVDRNRLRRQVFSALPSLPTGIRLVLFVQNKELNLEDIQSLCSKLS